MTLFKNYITVPLIKVTVLILNYNYKLYSNFLLSCNLLYMFNLFSNMNVGCL